MYPPVEMQLEVVPFIAVNMALVNYDTNFLRQPSRGRPQLAVLGSGDLCAERQNSRDVEDDLALVKVLVALTLGTITLVHSLVLESSLEHLRESDALCLHAANIWFRCWVAELVDECRCCPWADMLTVHTLDLIPCVGL